MLRGMKRAKNDLYPEWVRIDRLEQSGEMSAEEAKFLKEGIFEAMLQLGLEPDDVVRFLA